METVTTTCAECDRKGVFYTGHISKTLKAAELEIGTYEPREVAGSIEMIPICYLCQSDAFED